ncbi:MAG TPA: YncE family protein [Thermoplasmata archaeon]|nr:YncE family protein [Thermoplasmata archaeon]
MRSSRSGRSVVVVVVVLGALILVGWLPSASSAQPALKAATGVTACGVGKGPGFPGYDPVNHDVYVPNAKSGNITVLSGTCKHVGSIKLPSGAYPVYAAFDPQNDRMYVSDYALNQVYEIRGTSVVYTFNQNFNGPMGEVWDPGNSAMLVASYNSNQVIAIQGINYTSINTGTGPSYLAYDPYFATVLVTNFFTDNVTIINALSFRHVGDTPAGSGPMDIAFDPVNDYDYVTNEYSGNVTVMWGDGTGVGSIGGFKTPAGVAFNQANLRMYVAEYSSKLGKVAQVTALKQVGSNNTVSGAQPLGLAFDEYNNYMYVTNFGGSTVYILT